MSEMSRRSGPEVRPQFGFIATGIPSLDALLTTPGKDEKAMVFPIDTGFFGVIMGAAGTGKSVLSLQLCCAFVKGETATQRDRRAIYISQESCESVRAKIVQRFRFFNKSDESGAIDTWVTTDEVAFVRDPLCSARILLISLPLELSRQERTLDYYLELIGNVVREKPERWLICIDNAETLGAATVLGRAMKVDDLQPRESYYKRIRNICARFRLHTWWAFEEEHAIEGETRTMSVASTPQAYAADLVIRLSAREVGNTIYRERDLEIIKARHQGYRRGRHAISIYGANEGKYVGIVIWPSIATQLSIAQAVSRKRVERAEGFRLGILAVDEAVALAAGVRQEGPNYLAPGSISVLVSDLDSLATGIALHFGLNAGRENEATALITTSSDEDTVRRIVALYSDLRPEANRLRILSLTANYVSEGKLLQEIDEHVSDHRGGIITRIIFDNLFSIESQFPLIRDRKAFTSALFGVLRSKTSAASFVVDLLEVGEGRNPLSESHAARLANNAFLLRHTEFQSQVRKIFQVLKIADLPEPRQFWELEQRQACIHAVHTMDYFKGVLSGRPEPVEINLSLYADAEGSPLEKYLRTQIESLSQTFCQKFSLNLCHPMAHGALQSSLSSGGLRAMGDCHIVAIDEIWLQRLVRDDLLEYFPREFLFGRHEMSEDKAAWAHGEYVTTADDIAVRSVKPTERKRAILHDKVIAAVPERNNVGILAYNPNVWSFRINSGEGVFPLGNCPDLRAWAGEVFGSENRIVDEELSDLSEWPWESESVKITWRQLVVLQSWYVRFCRNLDKNISSMPASIYREWEDWAQRRMADESDVRRFPSGSGFMDTDKGLPNTPNFGRPIEFASKIPPWGVFTFSMNQRESCVSFLLELVLSLLPAESFLVEKDGRLRWSRSELEFISSAACQKDEYSAWGEALMLLLELISPWDILRLSHAWFRSTNDERPTLFSRQWFSSWGALGLREPGLFVKELPIGVAGCPTPVSGAWYLGILKNSTALRAGASVIRHFTSESAELFKVNRGIGLPVRRRFFEGYAVGEKLEVRVTLPYAKQFNRIGELQEAHFGKMFSHRESDSVEPCPVEVLESRCPFYRTLIENYNDVSPLLMGMMVRACRIALRREFKDWLWGRSPEQREPLRREIEEVVSVARTRYQRLMEERRT